jgi:hypothetical protein
VLYVPEALLSQPMSAFKTRFRWGRTSVRARLRNGARPCCRRRWLEWAGAKN